MIQRRHFTGFGLACGLMQRAGPAAAASSDYPTRPIKVVVASAAGGLVDSMARTIGGDVAKTLGQAVIIEPRPGANGSLAASFVAKAPPDGHTLLFTVNAFVLAPLLMTRPGYDIFRDFVPVSLSNYGLLVFVVGAKVPVRDMREFVELARAQPGKLSFGSAGLGSSGHLYGEKLMLDEKIALTHVPYKGSAPVMNDILGGVLDGGFSTMGEALGQARAGRVKILGVFGTRRIPSVPEVPTFTEQGFKGYEHGGFWGFFAPTGTSKPAIDRFASAVRQAVAPPEVRARMGLLGLDPVGGGADELLAAVRREHLLWSRVIRNLNFRLE